MFQNDPCKVLTDEVRLSYVHINEAYASPSTPGATPKFSVSLLIPKTNIALVEQIKAAIRAAAQTAASSQWGGFCLPETALFSILHDGDGVNQSGKPYGPEAKGCYVLGASSAQQPQVIRWLFANGKWDKVPAQPQEIYSGMYGQVTIRFFGTNKGGNKMCCGLNNVLKTRDGEVLAGRASAEDDFAGIEAPPANVAGQVTMGAAATPGMAPVAVPAPVAAPVAQPQPVAQPAVQGYTPYPQAANVNPITGELIQ